MSTSDLATRTTITELVRAYNNACRDIRKAFRLIADAERKLNLTFVMNGSGTIGVRDRYSRHHLDFNCPDEALKQLTRDAWRAITERLELRRMMSIKRAKELDEQLDKTTLPPITEETVWTFAKGYMDTVGEMLGEAVEEVFNWLRPPGSKYKRNSEYAVPRKVVLGWMVETRPSGVFCVCYRAESHLTALENVFTALDGQGMITKAYYSALSSAIKASPHGVAETPYFRARCFKNGNMHLEFLRLDLLARFNAMAGGRRLRAGSEAA